MICTHHNGYFVILAWMKNIRWIMTFAVYCLMWVALSLSTRNRSSKSEGSIASLFYLKAFYLNHLFMWVDGRHFKDKNTILWSKLPKWIYDILTTYSAWAAVILTSGSSFKHLIRFSLSGKSQSSLCAIRRAWYSGFVSKAQSLIAVPDWPMSRWNNP